MSFLLSKETNQLIADAPSIVNTFQGLLGSLQVLFIVGIVLQIVIIIMLIGMARGHIIIDREDSKIELHFRYPFNITTRTSHRLLHHSPRSSSRSSKRGSSSSIEKPSSRRRDTELGNYDASLWSDYYSLSILAFGAFVIASCYVAMWS